MERRTITMKQSRTMKTVPIVPFVLVCCFFLVAVGESVAQSQRYWVALRDRGDDAMLVQTRSFARELGISDRALWRRAKVLPQDRLLDERDLPVDDRYLRLLRAEGARIRSVSRWFNAVSVEISPRYLPTIQTLPWVASVKPVAVFRKHRPEISPVGPFNTLHKFGGTAVPEYGSSFVQLNGIKVVDVHAKGVTGQGVVIGMIDDGFNERRVHPALRNIDVLAEYDFIQRDDNTMRAPGEYSGQGNHGAGTLSVVGGYEEGKLIGAAYGASFLLAKTEIDSVEIQVEEDLYIEGLEWLERNGADIVSSSLGYIDWYTYTDLDGVTATTTKAARILARKGVLHVTAMGNEGTYRNAQTRETGTLIAPADADSIISVGATLSDGGKAGFSSTGPTADGRIKPEVVAQGVGVYAMYGEGGYTFANGTSFSTPLAAGVAALILSAHSELTPMEVRARMISTASPLETPIPNNFTGSGLLNALEAVGLVFTTIPDRFVLYNNYPNPFNAGTSIVFGAPGVHPVKLVVFNALGQKVRTLFTGVSRPGQNRIVWNDGRDEAGAQVATGLYLYRLTTPGSVLTGKMLYLK